MPRRLLLEFNAQSTEYLTIAAGSIDLPFELLRERRHKLGDEFDGCDSPLPASGFPDDNEADDDCWLFWENRVLSTKWPRLFGSRSSVAWNQRRPSAAAKGARAARGLI